MTALDVQAPQNMRALANANRVRLARAVLKHRIAERETTVQAVLADVPWEAETMTIADLLMAQHRWGRTRMRRLCAQIPVLESKQIGLMTDRQRHALIEALQFRVGPAAVWSSCR